jgi:hypothetical protein
VQVDVKFLTLARKKGSPVRRYQYAAIDDATRVRALKIYRRHTQADAIDFIDYVVKIFRFGYEPSAPIAGMSSRRYSTGTLLTWAWGTSISNRGRLSLTARSRGPIEQTKTSSTSYSRIATTWISRKS